MSQLMDKISMAREAFNKVNVADDLAFLVSEDLKEAGYDVKLVKEKEKKPSTWRILPVNKLSEEEREQFEQLKSERTDHWRNDALKKLKNMKKQLLK